MGKIHFSKYCLCSTEKHTNNLLVSLS